MLLGRRLLARSDVHARHAGLARSDLPWLAGAVLSGGVAAPIVLLAGLRSTPSATASLLLNFETVSTVLLAALFFREEVGRRVWMAVAFVVAAGVVLSWNAQDAWGVSAGALGIMAACALWGLDNNLTRKVSAKYPMAIVAIKGLSAGLFSLGLALLLGTPIPTGRLAGAIMLLGFGSYGLSIALFVEALRDLGAARTGALFGTAPFFRRSAVVPARSGATRPDIRGVGGSDGNRRGAALRRSARARAPSPRNDPRPSPFSRRRPPRPRARSGGGGAGRVSRPPPPARRHGTRSPAHAGPASPARSSRGAGHGSVTAAPATRALAPRSGSARPAAGRGSRSRPRGTARLRSLGVSFREPLESARAFRGQSAGAAIRSFRLRENGR